MSNRSLLTGKVTYVNVNINTTITPPSRGLLINSADGAIALVNITSAEDGTVSLVPLAPGVIHPIEVSAVWTAGTTATSVHVWK